MSKSNDNLNTINQGINLSKTKEALDEGKSSSIAVPILIILLGALIIFGITRMLSTESNYKNLVSDLESKTFGNRWVAAYELSKVLASNQLETEDKVWLMDNLVRIYQKEEDPRTRHFLLLALGSIPNKKIIPVIESALSDVDDKIIYSGIVSLGNFPKGLEFNWDKLIDIYQKSTDVGVLQVSALTLATHQVEKAIPYLRKNLSHENTLVRYNSALGLLSFKVEDSFFTIREILNREFVQMNQKNTNIDAQKPQAETLINDAQLEAVKINILSIIDARKISGLIKDVEHLSVASENIKIKTKALEVLNKLKN